MDVKKYFSTAQNAYKTDINNLIHHYEKIEELKEKRKDIK